MAAPSSPHEVDPAWMTDVLRASGALASGSVVSVNSTDIGEGTGIFGEIGRLDVVYDIESTGPPSVIIKMPCVEPENLAVAQALGIYEREVRFFEQVGPSTELRIPTCHLAELDHDGGFVLVLEDLSIDFEVGDQVVGATFDQAAAAIDALVALHTRWWDRDETRSLEWLPVPDAPAYMAAVPGIYRAGLPILMESWSDRVPAAAMDLAIRLDPRFEELMIETAGGPQTFAHGDTRLDNIFFERGGPGVAFIDFQLSLRGRAVTDLAYLVGTSVKSEVASECWEELLGRWHAQITDTGISYPWDNAIRHYRQCALFYLVGAMSLIGTFDSGNERGAAMSEAYLTRICNHIVDIDAGSVLD